MLKLLGRNNSINVQKVVWSLEELSIAYERTDLGGAFGGLDTPAYGALNPNRKIPVLQDGDLVLWESNAIVRYLAARYGDGGLWPHDPAPRALADRWMDWANNVLMPPMTVVFHQTIRTPAEKRDPAAIDKAAAELGQVWQIVEQELARQPWLGGTALTIGDIPAGAAYYRYVNLPIARPQLPACERWYEVLRARPAFQRGVMIPVT